MALRRAGATAVLLCSAWLLGGCASLQAMFAEDATPAATADAPRAAPARPAIRLRIDAPSELRALLNEYLDLARLQREPIDEALDATEASRLAAAAPAQARELLATEGYFDPVVTVQREAPAEGGEPSFTLTVDPGPRTNVASVKVLAEGPLAKRAEAGDGAARSLAEGLDRVGPARPGRPFRNDEWSATKRNVGSVLRAGGYAGANLSGSQADVFPAERRAELIIVADSGPLYRFGSLNITGLSHHDEEMVRNLSELAPGAALTEAALIDYQTRLQKTGLFDAVTVTYDPAPDQADAAEVRVRIIERALQQATLGLGYSNDAGARISVEHTHRRLLGRPLVMHNKIELGARHRYWAGDLITHPQKDFVRWLAGVQIEHLQGPDDTVDSQRLRLGRTRDTTRLERLQFFEALRSSRKDQAGSTFAAQAYTGNLHLVFRDLDSVLLPTRGVSLSTQLGAGMARSAAGTGPIARIYARGTYYKPFGTDWYGQARLEVGQVFGRSGLEVPDALKFRAGGDGSVRGYGYRSLAPLDEDGLLTGGTVLGTASVEIARPVSERMPSVWGAFFIDAGNAADRWVNWRPAVGFGPGVRWRSPIGPLSVDLAWGQRTRKARLHLSVGVVF